MQTVNVMPPPWSIRGITIWSVLTPPCAFKSCLRIYHGGDWSKNAVYHNTNKHGNGLLIDWFWVRALLTLWDILRSRPRHITSTYKIMIHSRNQKKSEWMQVTLSSCSMDDVWNIVTTTLSEFMVTSFHILYLLSMNFSQSNLIGMLTNVAIYWAVSKFRLI